MNVYYIYRTLQKFYATIPQQWGVLKGRAFPPLRVIFLLTFRCNLHCPYCRQRPQIGQKEHCQANSSELTFHEIQRFVDQTPPWALLLFSGGEIFTRKDIMEILYYASNKRRCSIITNGVSLSSEVVEQLVHMRLVSIGISIDGPEEVHDQLRGHRSFARTAATVELLVKERKKKRFPKFPFLNIKTTITHANVHCLNECLDLAEGWGVDYCLLQMMRTSNILFGTSLHDQSVSHDELPAPIPDFPLAALERQLNLIQQRVAVSRGKPIFTPNLSSAQILNYYANRLKMDNLTCMTPWTTTCITPTGKVFPCFNYYIGSLRESRLSTLWNSQRYQDFRRSLLVSKKRLGGCMGCCELIPISPRKRI